MTSTVTPMPARGGGPEQAEAWVARLLAPDCTPAERAAFEAWLAASPAHIDAYLQTEAVNAMARELSGDPMLRAAARRARRTTAEGASRLWRSAGWGAGLAAAVALFALVSSWWGRAPTVVERSYATAVGEQRTLTLEDGTELRLDTDTTVHMRFSDDRRVLELARGRAQVEVGVDAGRPLEMVAGAARIRDIGTTFQVRRDEAGIEVGLLDGLVFVSGAGSAAPTRLQPGQQVQVEADGTVGRPQSLDLAMAKGWPQGQLVFKQRRLDELLAEMNRYSRTPLRLGDAELAATRVSGVFYIGDQASLVAALQQGWGLRVERASDGAVVLKKNR